MLILRKRTDKCIEFEARKLSEFMDTGRINRNAAPSYACQLIFFFFFFQRRSIYVAEKYQEVIIQS